MNKMKKCAVWSYFAEPVVAVVVGFICMFLFKSIGLNIIPLYMFSVVIGLIIGIYLAIHSYKPYKLSGIISIIWNLGVAIPLLMYGTILVGSASGILGVY